MRVLSKSRFKLGLECPNKLYYTDKEEYANNKVEDAFLEALAQGGFQVEELARMHYPDGVLIEGNNWDYEYLHEQTQKSRSIFIRFFIREFPYIFRYIIDFQNSRKITHTNFQ